VSDELQIPENLCKERYKEIINPTFTKGSWTSLEDSKLKQLIESKTNKLKYRKRTKKLDKVI
jgi:hypothetical protein